MFPIYPTPVLETLKEHSWRAVRTPKSRASPFINRYVCLANTPFINNSGSASTSPERVRPFGATVNDHVALESGRAKCGELAFSCTRSKRYARALELGSVLPLEGELRKRPKERHSFSIFVMNQAFLRALLLCFDARSNGGTGD